MHKTRYEEDEAWKDFIMDDLEHVPVDIGWDTAFKFMMASGFITLAMLLILSLVVE